MRAPSLGDIDRETIRRHGLHGYLRLAWPLLDPAPFRDSWHLGMMCRHLEAVASGEIRGLVINVPPGHSKSSVVCVAYPTWDWMAHPERKALFASFDDTLVVRDANRRLAVLSSPWYKGVSDTRLSKSSPAAHIYFSTAQGLHFATTLKGRGTGWHGHVRVTDDPIKPSECDGAAIETAEQWWTGTWQTRSVDPSTVADILIMQRLHERDLAGFVLSRNGAERVSDTSSRTWVHVRLPARYEPKTPCRTPWGEDPRTEEGELLCPDRYDSAAVGELERALGPLNAAAQLQQRPVPPGGYVFQGAWFPRWTSATLPPRFDRILVSADLTFKKTEGGSNVAIHRYGSVGSKVYLLDRVCRRMTFTESVGELLRMSQGAHQVLIEDKANGAAAEDVLRSRIPGIKMITPRGDKVSRAGAIAGFCQSGDVLLPADNEKPWASEVLGLLTTFPRGLSDDDVDAMTQGVDYLLLANTKLEKLRGALRAEGMLP